MLVRIFSLVLSFMASIVSADEAEPIVLFQIDFDLTPDNAKEIAIARFGCQFEYSSTCILSGTPMVTILQRAGKLSFVEFECAAFEGCAYEPAEIKEALSEQKGLSFLGNCAWGELGERICVSDRKKLSMYREKFRSTVLVFD